MTGARLTYVAGSHRLTPERAAWERNKTVNDRHADRLSQRGSLRVETEELALLGLPQPTRFAVPANTLVAIDTSGFHARADSDHPTLRVELWALQPPHAVPAMGRRAISRRGARSRSDARRGWAGSSMRSTRADR